MSTTLSKAVERAIRRGTGATEIVDSELMQPVWGGNGEVLRVELAGARVNSVVVKHITIPEAKRKKKKKDASLVRTLASYDNELTFYREYATQLTKRVRVPHFYDGQRLDDGWVFVLEDMLVSGFLTARKRYTEVDIQAALTWLAGFHAAFMGSAADGLWSSGSYWNLSDRQTELARMTHPKLKAAASALDAALSGCRFKTIIHGDAKTDNFCFPGSGLDVAGVDFQHTGLGCGMKDVMCLLDSCLDPFEAAVATPDLLDLYFRVLAAALNERSEAEGTTSREWADAAAVEHEWRRLFPIAWADYYRFLDGWAPGKYPPEGYAEEMLNQALHSLAHG